MGNKELSTQKGSDVAVAEERKMGTWITPAVDIFENDEGLTLVADLPGVGKDGLNLGIDSGVLTIEGQAGNAGRGEACWSEFEAPGYYRRFQLPDNLDLDKVAAELKDGVLTLRMPKIEAARPRRIAVTVH